MMRTAFHIADYFVFFVNRIRENTEHHHFAHQICFAPNDVLEVSHEGGFFSSRRAVAIRSREMHHIRPVHDSPCMVLLLDPECEAGRSLAEKHLGEEPVAELGADADALAALLSAGEGGDVLLQHVLPETVQSLKRRLAPDLDDRISQLIAMMPELTRERLKVPAIAERVFLSESRLQHLFKQEMGIPLGNYLLWFRMRTAALLILNQNFSLSQAAYEAGFADAPHFTRTFRHFFGVTPTQILKT